ncbi:helix-turn-helix domain-containing protein [Helicobacter pylori]|nr:helix-turn-helix domain-containing protein [Helicobacter pylori]
MEQEKLQPIDLKVLIELFKKAHLPKTADKISKDLDIDYANTLKIFNNLEKKELCDQWVVNKKKEKEKKNNYYKVCCLNKLGKVLSAYLIKSNKTKQKRNQDNDHL